MMDNLTKMVEGITQAIAERKAEVGKIEGLIAEIYGSNCVGREWWRDKDVEGKTSKLYINHSIDQSCPLHGVPDKGDRIRAYVGSDWGKIADVREAMDKTNTLQQLRSRLSRLKGALYGCESSMRRFFYNLGYAVRSDGRIESEW